MTTISSTRSPMASHVDQFSSTQLAAFVALSWASWNVGTVGAVGEGDGDEPAAAGRTAADRDTADTSSAQRSAPRTGPRPRKDHRRDGITTLTGHHVRIRVKFTGETVLTRA
ncbi:hypothetical protein GCM10010377_11560 [Streptomyces viridiviolaceus]|nr:hypothetical protein GCM10010377_11560 [Streptomyces viridiviolaceus]